MRMPRTLTFLLCLGPAFFLGLAAVQAEPTALDRYVAKPDANFGYGLRDRDPQIAYTTYFLRLISQQWRNPREADRVLWEHDLSITVPRLLHGGSPTTALLLVAGGSNDGTPPTRTDDQVALVATALGLVVAVVEQIPNQPLAFADEGGRQRSEDAILAYSFDKFLTTGDEEWPVHLAMTKSVVRAMDAIQAFLADRSIPINDFVISGGSKRGWTTWLTAAVDPRVRAIAPASIDFLNLDVQMRRQWEAYGFFTPAVEDYVAFDIPCRLLRSPADRDRLLAIVDPYRYRERLTLPKLILNSTGDQYFLPDSSRFYFGDLLGPKLMRYAPNTDHAQEGNDTFLSAVAWLEDLLDGGTGPEFTWTFESDGSIRVQTTKMPDEVRLWRATNPTARDFRLATIGPAWTSTVLTPREAGVYVGYEPPPAEGWTAFMVELRYRSGAILEPDQVYTTDVRIVPDRLPFAGTACGAEPVADQIGFLRQRLWVLDWNGDHVQNDCTVDGCFDFAAPGRRPVVGDWNHDGVDDIGTYHSGRFRLDLNGNRRWDGRKIDGVYPFGRPGDQAVTGDWNGDGTDDLGMYRNGRFRLDMNGNRRWDGRLRDGVFRFGTRLDQPVAGDWNHDGVTDLGVFRDGVWQLDRNGNRRWDGCEIDVCYQFGAAGDVPVVGKWRAALQGDAIGIRRGAVWWLDGNGNGIWEGCDTDLCVENFGAAGDVAVVGVWRR